MTKSNDTSYKAHACKLGQGLWDPLHIALIEKAGFTIEGMWRMPQTVASTCSLIRPGDVTAPIRNDDGTLNGTAIGLIIGAIVLVVAIVIIVVVVIVIKKRSAGSSPAHV